MSRPLTPGERIVVERERRWARVRARVAQAQKGDPAADVQLHEDWASLLEYIEERRRG